MENENVKVCWIIVTPIPIVSRFPGYKSEVKIDNFEIWDFVLYPVHMNTCDKPIFRKQCY